MIRRNLVGLASLASLMLLALAAAATAAPPAGMERVTSVEGITEYRLANGLRVLLFPDPSKPTATVNITYLVGSRHENYGETGMAHLLEHLSFKGTPGHPDIPSELTAHGCRPNGSTWFDRTNYFETFAATDENLAWALDLEADRMVHSFIAAKDLESEMTVVRNEYEMGENRPEEVLNDRVFSAAYLWHNYGNTTIGARSDIEDVPIERLQAFYRTWYQPDNAVLVVAGMFDEAKTLALIADKFGRIPRPERALPALYTVEPAQDGERALTLRRVGDTQLVDVAYHIPAGSHPDFAAVDVLAYLLGDSPSGRLYRALVEPKKASSVRGDAFQLHDPGILLLGAEVRREDSVEEARDLLVATAEGLAAAPPTAAEVERARQALLKSWEQATRNSSWAAIQLSEWAAMGDWRLRFLYRDALRNVTPEDVARVAGAYLRPANRTVGLFIPTQAPDRVEVPPAPDVAALVDGYQGEQELAVGEEFDPTPEAIEARLVRTTLPNGLKVVMLPKKTRGELAQVAVSLHFGDETSLRHRATAGELAADMLMRGTKKHTRQEIRDEADRLRAQIRVGGSATGAFGGLEVSRQNLPDALRLLAEVLREPSFPAAELDLLKEENLAQLEEARSEPFQMAYTAWYRYMTPYPEDDVRYVPTTQERIDWTKKATLDEVRSFYADFYGASAGEIALVGDFDAAEMTALVTTLFGDWKSPRPYARIATPFRERPPCDQKIEAPDKESAVFLGGLAVNVRDSDPEYPALVLGDFMTGGGFLNSRLATRVRQKEGLSYRIRSRFDASAWEKDGWFTVQAIYAPQNAQRLETAVKEEIARVIAGGFTPEEVSEAQSGWLQSRKVSRAMDRELARTLASREFEGRTMAWDGKLEKTVSGLDAKTIQNAMKKLLDPKKLAIVKVGDFARVAREGLQPDTVPGVAKGAGPAAGEP